MSQRMHEVQQAVHDAEEEEAASGAGDSTGGQPLCCRPPRKRRDIPLSSAGTRLCSSPASAAVLARFPACGAGSLAQSNGHVVPLTGPAVPSVIRPGGWGIDGSGTASPRISPRWAACWWGATETCCLRAPSRPQMQC